eukprot:91561-Prorocentrum_minimum.AAC.2
MAESYYLIRTGAGRRQQQCGDLRGFDCDARRRRGDFAVLRGEFAALRGEFAALRGEFAALRGEFPAPRASGFARDRCKPSASTHSAPEL